jgi:hypothetical protein
MRWWLEQMFALVVDINSLSFAFSGFVSLLVCSGALIVHRYISLNYANSKRLLDIHVSVSCCLQIADMHPSTDSYVPRISRNCDDWDECYTFLRSPKKRSTIMQYRLGSTCLAERGQLLLSGSRTEEKHIGDLICSQHSDSIQKIAWDGTYGKIWWFIRCEGKRADNTITNIHYRRTSYWLYIKSTNPATKFLVNVSRLLFQNNEVRKLNSSEMFCCTYKGDVTCSI